MLYSYLKPESVRVHPEATVRPWATCQVVGDALSFASALGYMCVSYNYLLTKSIYEFNFDLTDDALRYTRKDTSFDAEHS